MATRQTKFAVGLFVLGGSILSIALLIFLGAGHLFQKGRYYATYFDESVQGLMKDSPVKYRGVPVGRVEHISVAPDGKLIQVVLRIESDIELDPLIVARLKAIGITGAVFVELERRTGEDLERAPKIDFPTPYPVVASVPSEVNSLMGGISDVLAEIRDLDLKGISSKMKHVLDNIDAKLADMDVRGLSNKMNGAAEDLGKLVQPKQWVALIQTFQASAEALRRAIGRVEKVAGDAGGLVAETSRLVSENRAQVKRSLSTFRTAMEKVDKLMGNADVLMGKTDLRTQDLYLRLRTTADSLERAGEALERFLDLITSEPSLLLTATPPRAEHPADEKTR